MLTVAAGERPRSRPAPWLGGAGLVGRAAAHRAAGWLRLAAVAHDPASLRNTGTLGALLGSRFNLLLHGHSPSSSGGTTAACPPPPAASPRLDDDPDGPLIVPAEPQGRVALLRLAADGVTTWPAATRRSRRRTAPGAPGARPPPPSRRRRRAPWPCPATAPGRTPGPEAPGDPGPDEVSGRAASPAEQLLDRVAEVVEVGYPGARVRRVAGAAAGAMASRRGSAAPAGHPPGGRVLSAVPDRRARRPVTEAGVDAFARHAPLRRADTAPSWCTPGPAPAAPLRDDALRRGIRVRSFTEFQGLLDLSEYVTAQTGRLAAAGATDALYVPQRYRDLDRLPGGTPSGVEGGAGAVRDDLVGETAARAGRRPRPVPACAG